MLYYILIDYIIIMNNNLLKYFIRKTFFCDLTFKFFLKCSQIPKRT